MSIDRHSVIARHTIEVTTPDAEHVLSVGNGDFAYTCDITGMQTFTAFHDPLRALAQGKVAVNTATMSTWGWHEMPNPDGFTLDDAMTAYPTDRGEVEYPDKYDMHAASHGRPDPHPAGTWLHTNPQRIDLGRIGLQLRPSPDAPAVTDPHELTDTHQHLDLWTGEIRSRFRFQGEPIHVTTVASPDAATVGFRIISPLLAQERASIRLSFGYPHDGFFHTNNWDAPEKHQSTLTATDTHQWRIDRVADATAYMVDVHATSGTLAPSSDDHTFVLNTDASSVDIVVSFASAGNSSPVSSFGGIRHRSIEAWRGYWMSGAAVDFSDSTDPRADELERRVVLSQYLTRVHSCGQMPPQETGLVTNSWQGKSHLEMHYWHAAHFAMWGRSNLLERSLPWYSKTLPVAQATARRQQYPGARWPKHVGPDGRESPSPIGSLLIWQQPHILYLLELTYTAGSAAHRAELVDEYALIVEETAAFMAAFAQRRKGVVHLGPPVMPAQEFYDARTTFDPTFELTYWWWGLEIAQRWRERAGLERHTLWDEVRTDLAAPSVLEGTYLAVGSSDDRRRDDHPSMLAAYGMVPPTPLIDPDVMSRTLDDVLAQWDWDSAWGWDFPLIAMTATRLGRTGDAFDALLRPETKNQYTCVGHNPQIGSVLPVYLPANGALLAAVALLSTSDNQEAPGWVIRSEGFPSPIAPS